MLHPATRKIATLIVVLTAGLAACTGGASPTPPATPPPSHSTPTPSTAPSATPVPSPGSVTTAAANLRADLDFLLGEHLLLAAKATGAALGGRGPAFQAYGALLNTNGTDLGAAIGSLYGDAARDEWNRIWSAHNGFFVDYTTGVATKDQAKQDKAVSDLTTIYVPEFSAFLAKATGLPQDAIAMLVTDHVLQTKAVVDAQAAGDWTKAYAAIRTAYQHMAMIGDALAPAIATQKQLPGDPSTPGVDFRVALNQLLVEHLYVATFATEAALGGRQAEFQAAAALLNTNGTDLGAAIGSLYGDAARDEWNRIWSAHNGFFVDYTTGVARKDQAKQDKAVSDLTTIYVPEFSAFLAKATGLPQDAIAMLVTDHVLQTKAVVDAQAAGDWTKAATADRAAGRHMKEIGDALAPAIVAALPEKFH